MSILGLYRIDWQLSFEELKEAPTINTSTNQIQILPKVSFVVKYELNLLGYSRNQRQLDFLKQNQLAQFQN